MSAALLPRLGSESVDEQVAAIQHALVGRRQAASLAALRGSRLGLEPIVWTGILLAAFQQLVGISVVKTYPNAVWQAVGFSTASAFSISMATVVFAVAFGITWGPVMWLMLSELLDTRLRTRAVGVCTAMNSSQGLRHSRPCCSCNRRRRPGPAS